MVTKRSGIVAPFERNERFAQFPLLGEKTGSSACGHSTLGVPRSHDLLSSRWHDRNESGSISIIQAVGFLIACIGEGMRNTELDYVFVTAVAVI